MQWKRLKTIVGQTWPSVIWLQKRFVAMHWFHVALYNELLPLDNKNWRETCPTTAGIIMQLQKIVFDSGGRYTSILVGTAAAGTVCIVLTQASYILLKKNSCCLLLFTEKFTTKFSMMYKHYSSSFLVSSRFWPVEKYCGWLLLLPEVNRVTNTNGESNPQLSYVNQWLFINLGR